MYTRLLNKLLLSSNPLVVSQKLLWPYVACHHNQPPAKPTMHEAHAALLCLGLAALLHLSGRRQRRRPPSVLPPLLEHINLNIPCERTARDFYVTLGGAVNPVTTNWRQLHINIGASQWHLLHSASRPDATPPGVPMRTPQIWPGMLELWTTEPLPKLHMRLARVHATCPPPGPPPIGDDEIAWRFGLAGRWPLVPTLSPSGDRLLCACPFGNRLEVREAPAAFAPEGSHPGGVGNLVALRRLVCPIRPGAAAAVADFFSRVLGCPAALLLGGDDVYEEDGDGDEEGAPPRCVVTFASGQTATFIECADAPPADAYEVDEPKHGYHLALYVDSHAAFGKAFVAAAAAGCLFSNPRFEGGPPQFSNAMTYELALECGQFRVRDVRDGAGALVLMLELEIRSPRHVSWPLGNKPRPSPS